MATLATITNRLLDAANMAVSGTAEEHCRVRALPNEDIYFFTKKIDNSRVIREADPRAIRAAWRAIVGTCVGVLAFTALLLPGAYSKLSGYQLHTLQQERQQLLDQQSVLEQQMASLLSPERLEQLARTQKLTEPVAGQVVHLNPESDAAVALDMNRQ